MRKEACAMSIAPCLSDRQNVDFALYIEQQADAFRCATHLLQIL